MNVKISSYNVRGLGNKVKRNAIFHFIEDQCIDICFIQEAHFIKSLLTSWAKESNYDMYFSCESTKSAGVGFLINRKKSVKVRETKQIEIGRAMYMQWEINNIKYNLINVYGPNKDDFKLLDNIINITKNLSKTYTILGGDWNLTLDPKTDKRGGNMNTHNSCRKKLTEIMEQFDLVDIWRTMHPNHNRYTWKTRKVILSIRLFYRL